MDNIREVGYYYDIRKDFNGNYDPVYEELKKINGVFGVSLDFVGTFVLFELYEWASDYDVLTSFIEIFDKYGLDVILKDDDVAKIYKEAEETETTKDADNVKTEKIKDKKADFIEKVVVLSISAVLFLVGLFLGKTPNAQMWVYMFSYTFAVYETLFLIITKIVEKKYALEEIALVLSTLVMLYLGKRFEACIITLAYSLSIFGENFIFTQFKDKLDNLKSKTDGGELSQNERREYDLIKTVDENTLNEEKFLISNRLKIHLVIIALGILVAFIPPLFNVSNYGTELINRWLFVGVCIIACAPFGSVLKTIKSTYYFGIDKLAENGIFIKNTDCLTEFCDINEVIFDKTGVLTTKNAEIISVQSDDKDFEQTVLSALNGSSHPIAIAVRNKFKDVAPLEVTDFSERENRGVTCKINGKIVVVGNKKLLKEYGVSVEDNTDEDSSVFVVKDGKPIGEIFIKYTTTQNAYGAVREISEDLKLKTTMISSDSLSSVNAIKEKTGINKAYSSASTEYKVNYINNSNGVYVGNSKYDIDTLKQAKLSVSVGESENSSAMICDGDLKNLPVLLKIAKRTTDIIKRTKILNAAYLLLAIASGTILSIFKISIFHYLIAFEFVLQLICALYSRSNSNNTL